MKRISPINTRMDMALNQMDFSEKAQLLGELKVLTESVISRADLSSRFGKSFGTNRDLYSSCGYVEDTNLTFQHYEARFQRQDIARRILMAPVRATWRKPPEVYDDENPDVDTEFEKIWQAIEKKFRIWNYLKRADILSGIGQYSVLLIGTNDGLDLSQEVLQGKDRQLLFLQPYSEDNAPVEVWEDDTTSERYSLPLTYKLKMMTSSNLRYNDTSVHWTRVIHIAEDLLENDVYATPRLKPVFNRLQDLETISAGSAEMFWQGAFPGLVLSVDADADPGGQTITDMNTEIKNYIHKLRRIMRLQGVTPHQLLPAIADPTNHAMLQLKLIAGTAGIPLRILIGSERGELASTQDDDNWNDRIDERRNDFADPLIRSLIDRFIYMGILPEPKSGEYFIDWPDIDALKEEDQAKIADIRSRALAAYCNAMGATDIYPPEKFLEREMGLSPNEIQEIKEYIGHNLRIEKEEEKIEEKEEEI